MSYRVDLAVFAGPMDLLLHLIEKNEIDIHDIPIAQITGQYLAYLASLEQLDLELASEFLVLAATLVWIKTRMLLPPPEPMLTADGEPEVDPREELVRRLLEYKKYKAAAAKLSTLEGLRAQIYECVAGVSQESLPVDPLPLVPLSLSDLVSAFQAVCASLAEPEVTAIPRDNISVGQRIAEIGESLVNHPEGLTFRRLFRLRPARSEIVVTFIAILEMMRRGQIKVYQQGRGGEIWLYRQPWEAG